MRIDTISLAEAKELRAEFACPCLVCQGKSPLDAIAREPVGEISRTIPGTIYVDSDADLDGTLSPGETFDVISLGVVAGQTYSLALRGRGDTPLFDPFMAVYDQNGAFLKFDDDGGAGITSLITFTALATGTYFITAEAFVIGDTGDYSLDVWVERPTDQVSDQFDEATLVTSGTTFGHLETSNDIDTYKVVLEAGKLYTFELAGGADYNTRFFNVPEGELDTILAIYAPDTSFIGFNDDISFPSDLSSGFSFVATESGTYYLDVLAYPGQTGGYTLDVVEVNLADFDPLDSIRWFNADNVDFGANGTAYVYFGDSGVNFGETADDGSPMVTIDWNSYEKQQVMRALGEYEKVLGVNYEITTDLEQATFRLLKTESEQYGAYFYPQDPAFGDAQGIGVFNVLSGGWDFDKQQSLEQGGYAFSVILHEFGHAHGLAHPHDRGGGSDVLLGVTSAFGSFGVFNLNQGVYTVMSYNDAWPLHPDGESPYNAANIDNGWSGSLGAFDIAALQERYGANPFATGNTEYQLQDDNQKAFYQTIWDTGGNDSIIYGGKGDAVIDLTAATLDYSPTGGGALSFVDTAGPGIWGGYTIANGVVIENGRGGDGNDVLIGNAAANRLEGNNGDDVLLGRGGNDILEGKNGADRLEGGDGNDRLTGENHEDALFGGAGDDRLDGGNEADYLDGGAGNDRLSGGNGKDTFAFNDAGVDTIADYQKGETIDFSALLGATRANVTLASNGKTIFVNLDAVFETKELTINLQGSSVNANDILFAPLAAAAASTEYMVAI